MKTDKIVDSKVTIMTDLGGKKSKVLLLKNETEIEDFKEKLRISGVVKSLPSKETIISEAIKYQDGFLDDPHSIADEAFIEGSNFILTALREDKIVR